MVAAAIGLLVTENGEFNVPKPVVPKLDESIDLGGFKDGKMFCVAAVLAFCVAANRENCDAGCVELAVENIELSFAMLSCFELLVPNENKELVPFAALVVSFVDGGVKSKSDVDDAILVGASSGFVDAASVLAENPPNEKTGLVASVGGVVVVLVIEEVEANGPKLKLGAAVVCLFVSGVRDENENVVGKAGVAVAVVGDSVFFSAVKLPNLNPVDSVVDAPKCGTLSADASLVLLLDFPNEDPNLKGSLVLLEVPNLIGAI